MYDEDKDDNLDLVEQIVRFFGAGSRELKEERGVAVGAKKGLNIEGSGEPFLQYPPPFLCLKNDELQPLDNATIYHRIHAGYRPTDPPCPALASLAPSFQPSPVSPIANPSSSFNPSSWSKNFFSKLS